MESELELVRTQLREKSEQYQSLQVVSRGMVEGEGQRGHLELRKVGQRPNRTTLPSIIIIISKVEVIVIPWLQGFIIENHPEPKGAARGRGHGFRTINP